MDVPTNPVPSSQDLTSQQQLHVAQTAVLPTQVHRTVVETRRRVVGEIDALPVRSAGALQQSA